MSKKIKDTDYLAVSACVRAMENELLTPERLDQLLAAGTDEETAKLLQGFGIDGLQPGRPETLDAAIARARGAAEEELASMLPDPAVADVFRLRYDYHNVKAILKADALGADARGMLSDLGRVSAAELLADGRGADLSGLDLPGLLGEAAREGYEVLSATRDPQLCDVAVDKWYYRDMLATAPGSAFLTGYVRLAVDAANLRTLVRTLRMGKDADFLRGVLFAGGETDAEAALRVSAAGGSGLAELYAPTPLSRAAEAGAEALRGGALTEFEKRCDDALSAYLEAARLVPFGEEPVLAYLAALETQYTNLRIVLMGRAAGVPAETIRARLRAACV